MRRTLVSGAAVAVVIGSLSGAAHAAETPLCVKSGSTLTITVQAFEPIVHLWVGATGNVIVEFADVQRSCVDEQSRQINVSSLSSAELVQEGLPTPTTWAISPSWWTEDVTTEIHNDVLDEVSLGGTAEADRWNAVVGDSPSLSLRGKPDDAELGLATVPSRTKLFTGEGDDTVELSVEGSAWTGADWIYPGAGADVVRAGAGDDRVVVDSDAQPDIVQPGNGDDELDLDPLDPSGAVIDPATPGGDGVAGNDDYGMFEQFRGTGGPDRFLAPESGMEAVGFGGNDLFVSGPGDDIFHADAPWGGGLGGADRVTYAGSDSGIAVTPTDQQFVEHASGHGEDVLVSMDIMMGSDQADTVQSTMMRRVRPGLGDDVIGFASRGTIVAEPGADGDDESLPGEFSATWNYSSRTEPLHLTIDGAANDGLPGERDNLRTDDGLNILSGSGDDLIVGGGGPNFLDGGSGDDRIVGHGGKDWLTGSAGHDRLTGGDGRDDLLGSHGNDVILEGSPEPNGSDTIYGNEGRDILSYAGRSSGVDVTIGNRPCDDGAAGEGDCLQVNATLEVVIGTSEADRLVGDSIGEHLRGGRGPDILVGREGSDVLSGEDGADCLTGGPGKDDLSGGAGGDCFHAVDSTKDVVRGGTGRDLARRDLIDVLRSIEGTF